MVEKTTLREKLGISLNRLIFITVRRLALRMGLLNLVDAVKILVDNTAESNREEIPYPLGDTFLPHPHLLHFPAL